MTTHPGRVAPRVSQWKQSGHVVVSPKVSETVRTERPGVHSVSRIEIDKWKRLRQKALTNPAVRGKIASLIKTRQRKAKETF